MAADRRSDALLGALAGYFAWRWAREERRRQVDEKEDPERYSELWHELISLQKDKRTRRSDR